MITPPIPGWTIYGVLGVEVSVFPHAYTIRIFGRRVGTIKRR